MWRNSGWRESVPDDGGEMVSLWHCDELLLAGTQILMKEVIVRIQIVVLRAEKDAIEVLIWLFATWLTDQ